jgi:hypothetical protein
MVRRGRACLPFFCFPNMDVYTTLHNTRIPVIIAGECGAESLIVAWTGHADSRTRSGIRRVIH